MDNITRMNYLMFENDQNNCWLDASIVLIVNSEVFKEIVSSFTASQIKNIIETYTEALTILNDDSDLEIVQRYEKTRKMLQDIQKSTLTYLKQFLKFKAGEPESAFCALLNLIYHDKSKIKESISVSWIWQKMCNNCGTNSKSAIVTKPIITLAKVKSFNPSSPTTLYTCSCKTEQEMRLIFKEVPRCVIFHFEKGAGEGSTIPVVFIIDKHEFHLTGIIILEKSSDPSVNHFVTWIRQPFNHMWLDCNDLNTSLVKFSEVKPELDLKDLYICMYETFDDFDKISLEISAEVEQTQDVDAELINLSDDDSKSITDAVRGVKNTEEEETSWNSNYSDNTYDCQEDGLVDEEEGKINKENCDTSETVQNFKTIDCKMPNDQTTVDDENNSISTDKYAMSPDTMSPDTVKPKDDDDSRKHESENVNKSEIETKEIPEKSEISSALNEKKEIPCTENLVGEKNLSKKFEGHSETRRTSSRIKQKNDFENTLAKLKMVNKNSSSPGYFGYPASEIPTENEVNLQNNKSLPSVTAINKVAKEESVDNIGKRKENEEDGDDDVEYSSEKQQRSGNIKSVSKEKVLGKKCKTARKKQNSDVKDQEKETNNFMNGNVEGDLHKNPTSGEESDIQQIYDEGKIDAIVENVFGHFMKQMCDIHERNNWLNH